MQTIKQILIERDGMTADQADAFIQECKSDLNQRLMEGEDCYDICEEYFGLEPDYLMELLGY